MHDKIIQNYAHYKRGITSLKTFYLLFYRLWKKGFKKIYGPFIMDIISEFYYALYVIYVEHTEDGQKSDRNV
jgi:hypothetical protein